MKHHIEESKVMLARAVREAARLKDQNALNVTAATHNCVGPVLMAPLSTHAPAAYRSPALY